MHRAEVGPERLAGVLIKKLYRSLIPKGPNRHQHRGHGGSGDRRGDKPEGWKRSFRIEDLCPVPEDYLVGPPDFVGIASSRAGTSWWYQLLLDHPEVRPNRLGVKELRCFYHYDYRGPDSGAIEAYRQGFAAPRGCICGEWSPLYLSYPLAIRYLAQAAPQAKLLAIVRNPIDRLLSAINLQLALRKQSGKLGEERSYVIDRFMNVMSHGLFHQPFQRLLKVFDRSQLLVLQYEQCRRDPRTEIGRTYRFLGLADTYIPKDIRQKVNVLPHIVPEFRPDERARILDYFIDDVHAFAELFPEIDLSLWPDFEDG